MRTFTLPLISALAFATAASASSTTRDLSQLLGLGVCPVSCLEQIAPLNGCPGQLRDRCVCGNAVILGKFEGCVVDQCGAQNVADILNAVVDICKADGITVTLTDPLAPPAPTATATA